MKIQMLPSTIDENGKASARQHLLSIVVDDSVAIDAGCLALSCTDLQRSQIRDVVLTHTHLDHIAGLPLFIDDLFSTLQEPVRIHASEIVISLLEEHIFNWSIYPRFSELRNENGPVMEYVPFQAGREFSVRHLRVLPVEVNHKVPSCGFVVSDGRTTIAMTGDTAETGNFWNCVNGLEAVNTVLVECAFPDGLADLAGISYHLTPSGLARELEKLERTDCEIFVVNIKPSYRDEIVSQIGSLDRRPINILEVGRIYEW